MNAHTPGPWVASEETTHDAKDALLSCFEVGTDGYYRGSVCSIQSADHIRGISRAEARANAQLIAAAPDLKAAAHETISALHEEYPIFAESDDDYIYDTLGSSLAVAYFSARAAIAKATQP